jgi:hypothetical protein
MTKAREPAPQQTERTGKVSNPAAPEPDRRPADATTHAERVGATGEQGDTKGRPNSDRHELRNLANRQQTGAKNRDR